MISLVLDTNIWIAHIAKNWPSGIIDVIKKKKESGEIILLSNEIIIQEWNRNKETTLKDLEKKADAVFVTTEKVFESYSVKSKGRYSDLIEDFLSHRNYFKESAKQHIDKTEQLLNECEIIPVTDKMKIRATEWALEKKAPFIKNKNSVADALIIISAAEYLEKKSIGITDSIFVSFNSEEFSSKKDKNEIHSDLKALLDEANMKFTRHLGEALSLPNKMLKEIDEYVEYYIQDWIETEISIARGK